MSRASLLGTSRRKCSHAGFQKPTNLGSFMADEVVQVYQGGTLAQSILATAPDGMLIALSLIHI